MNVTLERPSTAEAADWLASDIEAYTADLVAAGMDPNAATEKARREQTELLPLGLDTPGDSSLGYQVTSQLMSKLL